MTNTEYLVRVPSPLVNEKSSRRMLYNVPQTHNTFETKTYNNTHTTAHNTQTEHNTHTTNRKHKHTHTFISGIYPSDRRC